MEFFWIWLYLTLSKIGSGVISVWWALVACGFALIVMAGEPPDLNRKGKIFLYSFLSFGVLIHALALLVPDKEELAWIIGGGVALKIAQTEEAQKLPDNNIKALNKFLESVHNEEVEQ